MEPVAKILSQPQRHRILVVGLARSGASAARALARLGAQVTGTDRKQSLEGVAQLESAGVRLVLGGDHPELLPDADLVVLSPGVPLTAAIPAEASHRAVPMVGELELAYRLSQVPMVAITGTNGKSTTTALCSHILQQGGQRVFMGGNIGRPLTDLYLDGSPVDWAVVEVSSFQLEHLTSPSALVPRVAVWLNLTPDHLDRHGCMENYSAMKLRLFQGQGPEHTGVFFLDDPEIFRQLPRLACRVTGFSRDAKRVAAAGMLIQGRELKSIGTGRSYRLRSERLIGDHNAENAAAAVLAATAMGADPDKIQAALDSYPGLPHRLEPVRLLRGVRYINDSKGTNVDATLKSLTSFEEPVILLAGGRGKGTSYDKLRQIVSERVKHLILMGEDAERLQQDLKGCTSMHRVSGMAEAVLRAKELAVAGDVVLLSPACASFDMFMDYAHRGRVFSELVRSLEEGP